jgi:hypothetical protein
MERFFTRGQRMSALLAESGELEDFIVPTVTMAEKIADAMLARREANAASNRRRSPRPRHKVS